MLIKYSFYAYFAGRFYTEIINKNFKNKKNKLISRAYVNIFKNQSFLAFTLLIIDINKIKNAVED